MTTVTIEPGFIQFEWDLDGRALLVGFSNELVRTLDANRYIFDEIKSEGLHSYHYVQTPEAVKAVNCATGQLETIAGEFGGEVTLVCA